VIDAVVRYYRESNANTDGAFLTSRRSDAIIAEAHQAMADMLGAASPDEIKFGPNMTTLTFHISRSIVATMAPGDEIVLTGLDHHGNVDPWLGAARDRGLTVRFWEPRLEDCTAGPRGARRALSPKTRLVAVGWASNAVGTINPSPRSSRGRTRPAPGRTSTRSTRRRTCRSTSTQSGPTSSPARRTSSSGRTAASSTAG
jgi:selenocysteine lyase/cysteine desulfurase